MIENQEQLAVTQRKLALIEARLAESQGEPASPVNDYSRRSMFRIRKQMLEEIIRFRNKNSPNSATSAS